MGDPWGDNTTPVVWRLGDVINSRPVLVASATSHYDILYGDPSYTPYKAGSVGRRLVAYFGANDGMLHAVNIGFPTRLDNSGFAFRKTGPDAGKAHDLGAEIWAYIPTSLLPHLRWLPDPLYNHAYYVDLRPSVYDVKINGEWRTVLIGGLRLGGRPIEAPDPQAAGDEHFYSEVFALDVTDPESDPVLLWRYSAKELGLTVGLPTLLSAGGQWYAVLPTGPVTDTPVRASDSANNTSFVQFGGDSPYNGYSNQKARLIVLDAGTGAPHPSNANPGFLTVEENNSFFNNPFLPIAQFREPSWTNHALYYGLTVSRDPQKCTDTGAVYRLKTVDAAGQPLPVSAWQLKRFISTGRPVTGAVNSTYDSAKNLWVIFGTGRLWGTDDVTPCIAWSTAECEENHVQYLFGIKEELNSDGLMTFSERTAQAGKLLDVSGGKVYTSGDVTGIKATALLPGSENGSVKYSDLSTAMTSAQIIGYKRALRIGDTLRPGIPHSYEMVLTQPKFVPLSNGTSLAAFTSFEPRATGCGDLGDGYLYLVDAFTGLPAPSTRSLFTATPEPVGPGGQTIATAVDGATYVGTGKPTEAFVVTSAGGAGSTGSSGGSGGGGGGGGGGGDDLGGGSSVCAIAEDGKKACFDIAKSSTLTANGQIAWREVLDAGFELSPEQMITDLP
ncbi:MAG: hypothetical protein LBW85_07750 [Deltaproteobacteria bacterium]|nr:hypothetical protein [Deltaproteobacteria bacterium]